MPQMTNQLRTVLISQSKVTGLQQFDSMVTGRLCRAVSLKADRTTAQSDDHDCTQSYDRTTANNRLACSRQDLAHAPRYSMPGASFVLVNTRRPCPCLLDRGMTAVSRRLVSVVPCSTQNEANSQLTFDVLSTIIYFQITCYIAFLVSAVLKLHGMLNLSSCGNAYTDSVRS